MSGRLLLAARLCVLAATAVVLPACARPRVALAPLPTATSAASAATPAEVSPFCLGCTEAPESEAVRRAVEQRVADLKARGGACRAYGEVLEESLSGRRIVVRPFMWRVGPNLASAQALATGEIDVAREVDALNVGVRSVEEVVHSVEHEAAHIAFAIPSGQERTEALVNERVEECRAGVARVGAAR